MVHQKFRVFKIRNSKYLSIATLTHLHFILMITIWIIYLCNVLTHIKCNSYKTVSVQIGYTLKGTMILLITKKNPFLLNARLPTWFENKKPQYAQMFFSQEELNTLTSNYHLHPAVYSDQLFHAGSVSRLDCFIVPRVVICSWLWVYTYMKLTQPVPAGGAIQTKLRFVVGRWLTWDATTLHMNWFPNWWSDIIPGRETQREETVTRVNGSLWGANRPRNASAMCFIMATGMKKPQGYAIN